jgi:hypothetical protein
MIARKNPTLPNKKWLSPGCPPRVESVMTIQLFTLKSERALRQPVAAL